jgi:hypothetical protein
MNGAVAVNLTRKRTGVIALNGVAISMSHASAF